MDDLRIQIVNYRTKKYLIQCVGSLLDDLKHSAIKAKIAILDNASGDDLSDIKNLFPDAPISIFENQENAGFGAGHNLLATKDAAEAHYLLILNPDIQIRQENTLVRMLRQADKLAADVIGPRLVTTANKTQHWDHGELRGSLARITLAAGGSYWKEQDKLTEVAWVSGAFFLIRKKLFDKIGGFDEKFFLYKEEEDLCLRIRKKGGHIWYDPGITALHYGSVVAKKSDHMQKSAIYFLEKHFRNNFLYYPLRIWNKLIW